MTVRKNPFKGADDIYLTKKHIAVRRMNTFTTRSGNVKVTDNTRYYKKNRQNFKMAIDVYGCLREGR